MENDYLRDRAFHSEHSSRGSRISLNLHAGVYVQSQDISAVVLAGGNHCAVHAGVSLFYALIKENISLILKIRFRDVHRLASKISEDVHCLPSSTFERTFSLC